MAYAETDRRAESQAAPRETWIMLRTSKAKTTMGA